MFRLFSAFPDISHQVQQFLIEEYSNEAPRKDGEIYRKIRQYHFQRNLSFEIRWWARLRGNRAKNLKALLRHDEIRSAFGALLDVTGLWEGIQLTTIHKMMALKFDEVCPDRGQQVVEADVQQGILNSLDRIRCFWHDLLDGDVDAMRKVDEPTVKALELKAPGSSTLDTQTIQRQLGGAQIFIRLTFSEEDFDICLGKYIHSFLDQFHFNIGTMTFWLHK